MVLIVDALKQLFKISKGYEKTKIPDAQVIFDARSSEFLELVRKNADHLIESYNANIKDLEQYEHTLFSDKKNTTISNIREHLAIKLALSKVRINRVNKPLRIGIIVPVFQETTRMRPRSSGRVEDNWEALIGHDPHPNGENFVCEKSKQFEWLISGTNNIDAHVLYIDDACNDGSGKLIQQLIQKNNIQKTHVYDLRDLIVEVKTNPDSLVAKSISDLNAPEDSQKSGSVYAGMAIAIEKYNCDIVIYTDADLSYDLGQIGNLIYPLIAGDTIAGVADRRNIHSYTEDIHTSGEKAHDPGKRRMKAILGSLRAYLFSNILPPDTQAGFKAIWSKYARPVIEMSQKDPTFAFDVQFLARLNQITGSIPASVATVCIDSPEETTADGTRTYQLMAKTYLNVLDELNIPLNDQQSQVYHILESLAGGRASMSDAVWKSLTVLMEDIDIILPNDISTTRSFVKDYFSVASNNTAVSLNLEHVHIEHLKRLIEYVNSN